MVRIMQGAELECSSHGFQESALRYHIRHGHLNEARGWSPSPGFRLGQNVNNLF